jgi:hypothetical protein
MATTGKINDEEAFSVVNDLIKHMRREGKTLERGIVSSTENYVITLVSYDPPISCDRIKLYKKLIYILVWLAIEKIQPNLSWTSINYDDAVAIVMRTNKGEELNNLLALRITDRIENLWSMTDLHKLFKILEKYNREDDKLKICARCCKKGVKKCPCGKERYCSSECQKKDWELHKHIHN